jgi:hypothetical protein
VLAWTYRITGVPANDAEAKTNAATTSMVTMFAVADNGYGRFAEGFKLAVSSTVGEVGERNR